MYEAREYTFRKFSMIDGSGKRRTVDRERHVLGSEADETRQEPRKKSCRPRRRCTVAVRPGSQSLRPDEGDLGRPGRGASSRLAAGAARQRDGVSAAARGGDPAQGGCRGRRGRQTYPLRSRIHRGKTQDRAVQIYLARPIEPPGSRIRRQQCDLGHRGVCPQCFGSRARPDHRQFRGLQESNPS